MSARGAVKSARRQRGVALLLAILLVAIATILAAAIGYGSAMSARRAAATIAFDEGLLVGQAAEALAAFGLRADLRAGAEYDYPGEAWAKPVGPIEISPGVQLEASLEDVQGRFNLNSLVTPNGVTDPESVLIFQRLLQMVGLEPKWAQLMADWIDSDSEPGFPDGAEDNFYTTQNPPYRTPNILVTSSSELLALPGFGRDRYLKIEPYVTALPQDATINIWLRSCAARDRAHHCLFSQAHGLRGRLRRRYRGLQQDPKAHQPEFALLSPDEHCQYWHCAVRLVQSSAARSERSGAAHSAQLCRRLGS